MLSFQDVEGKGWNTKVGEGGDDIARIEGRIRG
jgi:hypothetical protein